MTTATPRPGMPRIPDADPPADTRNRNVLTPVSLLLVLVVFWLMTQMSSLVVSALMAVLLGTVLEGPVRRMQDRNIPRAAAIAICYVAIIGLIAGIVFLIVPVVRDQAGQFRDEIPAKLQELHTDWAASNNPVLNGPGASLMQSGIDFLDNKPNETEITGDTAASALPVVAKVGGGIASIITTLVITFYYMLEKKLVRQVVLEQLSPRVTARVDYLWTEVENKVGGWLRGQLLLCLIIGSIATISYGIIGLNFWPLLGLWAGVTEIIPIVGPWLGGIPAVLVALTDGPRTALIVALIILAMQSLENWFLVPRVMRGAVGLTPLTVFVAILAGTELMGIIGAVLAIPIVAGVQVVLTDLMHERRARLQTATGQMSGWRWMLGMGREQSPATQPETTEPEQIVSQQTYTPDLSDDDEDEAQAESHGDSPEVPKDHLDQSVTATWPSNPWKDAGRRRSSTWQGTRRTRVPGTSATRDETGSSNRE